MGKKKKKKSWLAFFPIRVKFGVGNGAPMLHKEMRNGGIIGNRVTGRARRDLSVPWSLGFR